MLQALSDFISKVTRGETLEIAGQKARWQKVAELTPGTMIAVPDGDGVGWDEIVSITRLAPEQVYDVEVAGTHNFVAGHFVNEKTGGALTPKQEVALLAYKKALNNEGSFDSVESLSKELLDSSAWSSNSIASQDGLSSPSAQEMLWSRRRDLHPHPHADEGGSPLHDLRRQTAARADALSQLASLGVNPNDCAYGGIIAHNTTGKALLTLNETGDQNILVASASGSTQATISRTGIVTAAQFQDQADTTYFLDPAATGTGLKLNGDIELTGGGTISSTANNNITINAGSGTVCIGAAGTCAGKLDSGTLDPPYTINGRKYATYVPSMVGIKEETTGTVETGRRTQDVGHTSKYPYAVIDFRNQEEGSDLWLFSKVTALKKHIGDMVVLLSPAGNTRAWYEVIPNELKLVIYTSKPTTVSYRLSAPRFDSDQWANAREEGSIGHVINDETPHPTGANVFHPSGGGASGIALDETGYLAGVEIPERFGTLSPLSDAPGDGIAVKLAPSQTFGIYTKEGSPSAVFDDQGNATFSGTLYADRIVTRFGDIENLRTTTVSATYITNTITNITQLVATPSATPTPEVRTAFTSGVESDATSSALLALLHLEGESNFLHLPGGALLVSGPLIIGSEGIQATSDTLYIEKGKTATLDILAGTLVVNTVGDVIITGNLAVSGNVVVGGVLGVDRISPSQGELTIDLTRYGGTGTESGDLVDRFGKFLFEREGKEVAAITASGAGVFRKLFLTSDATASSSGTAILPALTNMATVSSTLVTPDSLIYVTPSTSTGNQVLYIAGKEPGVNFTVAVDAPIKTDVLFSWWIIN